LSKTRKAGSAGAIAARSKARLEKLFFCAKPKARECLCFIYEHKNLDAQK